eukprot:2391114-Rhodomonas_salina.3
MPQMHQLPLAGDHEPPVGADGDAHDLAVVLHSAHQTPSLHVPHLGRPVSTARRHQPPVGGHRHPPGPVLVPLLALDQLAPRVEVPDAQGAVDAAARAARAVGGDGDAEDLLLVGLDHVELRRRGLARGRRALPRRALEQHQLLHVPHADRQVPGARHRLVAVGAQRHAEHLVAVPVQRRGLGPGHQVPDLHRLVEARARGHGAARVHVHCPHVLRVAEQHVVAGPSRGGPGAHRPVLRARDDAVPDHLDAPQHRLVARERLDVPPAEHVPDKDLT